METVRFFRGKRHLSVYGGNTDIATDITIFDTYASADNQRSNGDIRAADFVIRTLAGSTTVDQLPGHVLISGYTPLLALPALCQESSKTEVDRQFQTAMTHPRACACSDCLAVFSYNAHN